MTKHTFIKRLVHHYSKVWELKIEFTNDLLYEFTQELGDKYGFDDESMLMIHAELMNTYPNMDMKTMEQVVDWGLLNSLGNMFDIELDEVKKYFEDKS